MFDSLFLFFEVFVVSLFQECIFFVHIVMELVVDGLRFQQDGAEGGS